MARLDRGGRNAERATVSSSLYYPVRVVPFSRLFVLASLAMSAGCGASDTRGAAPAASGGGASAAGTGGANGGGAGAKAAGGSSGAGGTTASGGGGAGGSAGSACIDSGMRPGPRSEMMSAFDAKRGRLVFFGGDDGIPKMCNPAPHPIGELWTYDVACKQFTQTAFTTGPSPRARGAAAYDAAGDRVLVFGGRFRAGNAGVYTLYDEVWSLDLATLGWTLLATTGPGPSARINTVAVVDPIANALVIYGGNASASGASFTPLGDVWILHLDTLAWEQKKPVGAQPKARLFHGGAIDPLTGRLFVYGGGGANAFTGPFYGDLWSLSPDRTTWSLVAGEGTGPANRIWPTIVLDATSGKLVLFGGHDDGAIGNQNDTWTLAPATETAWTTIIAPEVEKNKPLATCNFPVDFTNINANAPDRRSAQAAGLDSEMARLHVFGGKTDCGLIDDAWTLDVALGTWSRDVKAGSGEACVRGDHPDQCSGLCN